MRENCHKCVHKVICDLWGEIEGVDAFNYRGNNGSECAHFALDGWIPVTERLPEDYEKVLTCDHKGNIHVMGHHHDFIAPFGITSHDPRYFPVTHWMPLPIRPGEEMRNHNILTKEK